MFLFFAELGDGREDPHCNYVNTRYVDPADHLELTLKDYLQLRQ